MKQRKSDDRGRASVSQRGLPTSPSGLVDQLSPDILQARRFWASGEQEMALRVLRGVLRAEPKNVRGFLDLARCYLARFEIDRFETTLNLLRALAPDEPGVHHLAGESYLEAKMMSQSAACLERAINLPGVRPKTWLAVAQHYERIHRLDEAEELLNRARAADADVPLGDLLQARIDRRRGKLSEAEQRLRTLIARLPTASDIACEAWGELAELLDRQQDYAGAWEAIEQAHRPLLQHDGPIWQASEAVLGRFRVMLDQMTKVDFQRWTGTVPPGQPYRVALLTGFPRSGTTLLEQVLDAHSALVSSEERDFLAQHLLPEWHRSLPVGTTLREVVDCRSMDQLAADRQRYLGVMESFLKEPIGTRLHLDKNPAYTPIIPIMLRLFPECRLVVALRDPRDVVLSCFLRYLPLNPVSVRFLTLERTIERYLFDMQAWLKYREWLTVPWQEVRYEDLVDDLPATIKRVLALLDLPWEPEVLNYRERMHAKVVNSPSYAAVQRPVDRSAIGRWKNYEPYFGRAMDKLSSVAAHLGYTS